MLVKKIVAEDFVNYKVPSMFIGTCYCDWKCCVESGNDISMCQNSPLNHTQSQVIDDRLIAEKYLANEFTQAIVFGGLEPFLQLKELIQFIEMFRYEYGCNDDIVIYTGYNEDELANEIYQLSKYNNVIVKFGRYIPTLSPIFDEVLGVELASCNQYAKRIK